MEVINITEEQKNNLCQELAKLVFELKKYNVVECIYFAPYKGLGKIRGNVLEITLVKQHVNNNDINNDIEKRNKFYFEEENLRKFGIKIFIDTDLAYQYTVRNLNRSEVIRSNNLFNSTIIFDRTGKYTKIKEQKNKMKVYENLAEIIPPIKDEIYEAIELIQMKRDTEVVKEFTKTQNFQMIKNMK